MSVHNVTSLSSIPVSNCAPTSDGRTARTERTRIVIVDSLLDLLQDGELQPTAAQIAERAGISLRLIYHHFGDLESLFREAAYRQSQRIAALAQPLKPTLDLSEKIEMFVQQRCDILEWITPIRMASSRAEPYSLELQEAREKMLLFAQCNVSETFKEEIQHIASEQREIVISALHALTTWGAWNDLRLTGKDIDSCKAAVQYAIRAILTSQHT